MVNDGGDFGGAPYTRKRARARASAWNLTHLPALRAQCPPSKKLAPMVDVDIRLLAREFRARAEEMLLRAETMHDGDARLRLCEIAASYERLAQWVEQGEPPRDKESPCEIKTE